MYSRGLAGNRRFGSLNESGLRAGGGTRNLGRPHASGTHARSRTDETAAAGVEGGSALDLSELSEALGYIGVDASPSPSLRGLLRGVVRVFASFAAPDFGSPWRMTHQEKGTASGFCTQGRIILTNAHAVAYQTSVQVRKHGDSEKYAAKVIAVAHEVDVALLTVEDDAFWSDAVMLSFGRMPVLQQSVAVAGFPVGGDTISITGGVVSRIDFDQYAHSTRESLVCQVDAAINPGNSGGPVLSGGKVVGIAFQSLQGAEGVGYIIPSPVVQHVLEDVRRHGRITGFARLGFVYQGMESPTLRSYLKVPKGITGVMVVKVLALSNLSGKLQRLDVVTSIDGHAIANDGTVAFQEQSRIDAGYLLASKFIGDPIELTLFRNGTKFTVTSTVEDVPDLVPPTLYERKPSYLVHAGLVFTPCTEPFVEALMGDTGAAPLRLLSLAQDSEAERPGQQVVVLAALLSHAVNVGYEEGDYVGQPLTAINGSKVSNLLEVAVKIRDATGPFIEFEISGDLLIVLPLEASRTATADVLKQHTIPAPMSEDITAALADPAAASVPRSAPARDATAGAEMPHVAAPVDVPTPAAAVATPSQTPAVHTPAPTDHAARDGSARRGRRSSKE